MICLYDNKSECQGPIDGSRWWNCPVHGVRLTEAWTRLCQRDLAYYNKWKDDSQEPLSIIPKIFKLGDNIGAALKIVGITDERVTKWLGKPCGCSKKREKLNYLGEWAYEALAGKTDNAKEHLEELIEDSSRTQKNTEGQ